MTVIELETLVAAPRERVFDLARSIDAHQDTASTSGETAIAGVTTGLLGPSEEVTWRARHFGVWQRLRSKMAEFDRPRYFQDVMVEGAFRQMRHEHWFGEKDGKTLMRDRFEFSAPCGILGCIVERLILRSYMRRFLIERNMILKQVAESDAWRKYLA